MISPGLQNIWIRNIPKTLSCNKKRQSFPAIDNLDAESKTFKVEVSRKLACNIFFVQWNKWKFVMLILLKFIFSRNKLIILSRPKMESIKHKSEAYLLGPCQISMMKFSRETS